MAVAIGEDERPREEDFSGLYDGYLAGFEIVEKPEWKIESQITKYGKNPDKIDHQQYEWTFRLDDPKWLGPETMATWTSRSWSMKANAYRYGSTLLNGPIKSGMNSDDLIGKRCRVSVSYSEKGRNYIDDIKPPKRPAVASVRPASEDPEWQTAMRDDPGPDEDE